MMPTWLIDSSSCYASEKPEALFNFHIKRDTTVFHLQFAAPALYEPKSNGLSLHVRK